MRYLKTIILSLLIIATTNIALEAHDWYPFACCSDKDCRQIACTDILEKGKALAYHGFGFYDQMIKPSQDDSCHVCISNEFSKDFTPVPHCIFIQQGS